MKIAVCSYSFQRYLAAGTYTHADAIAKAKELGFQGYEFNKDKDISVATAGKLAEACAKAGLPVVSFLRSGSDFLNPAEGGDWKAEAKRLEEDVRIAKALGAPLLRHDATRGGKAEFADSLPDIARGCRAVTEYAAGLGVRTMVENHGYFVQASSRCKRLMEAVNHPNFGSLVDMGNFLCADDDPVQAVTRMAPYAFHCHAKDFHVKPRGASDPGKGWFKSSAGAFLRGAIVGHGDVDIRGCIRALRAAGYQGWLSIEFEGLEDNAFALETGLANLKGYLDAEGCLDR
jgi:sugar phosphate isomerase/epimerase